MGLYMTGCLFLFIAVWFLPWIVVAPRKCANLVNVGTLLILASFSVLKGPYQFLVQDLLCNKKVGVFAILYLLSLLLTLYSAMILKSYVLTIISLVVEIVCVLYFVASYFPGGRKGMNYMFGLCWSMIKNMCD